VNIISATKADRIDFGDVSSAALAALDMLIPKLLPGGYRSGDEWVCRNPTRNDGSPGSFKVNLRSGVWSDFATGDKGGDAIDLMVYLEGSSNLEAARELAVMLGVRPSSGSKALTGNIRPVRRSIGAATPAQAKTAPQTFPPRTAPNPEGKPVFIIAGDEGPRARSDEKRRHVYCQGGVPVRIKIILGNGDGLNAYRVSDGEQTGWQYRKPAGFADVPYFKGENPFEAEQPIYWPEGEKDTDTLSSLGLPAFTFGGTGDGLPDGCWSHIAGRSVVILSDNDDDGRKHADHKAIFAYGAAASVRVVHFPDTAEKGDVSDWLEGRTAADLAQFAAATAEWEMDVAGLVWIGDRPESVEILEPEISSKPKLPPGFSFSDRGLMWQNADDMDKPAILIAGHFDVVAETRDADGTSWGVLLEWRDHDDRPHRFALPRSTLAGDGSEARRSLMDGGFYISPSQTARGLFNSFLLQVKSPSRARATERVGWHGNAFVLPDHCFGNDERDALLLQNVTAHQHSFRQSGTLESWQNSVARYAIGNSRLVLALSAAFAGPLVGPCSAEGGGLHFKGASSTGKSTALHVAGSAWGGGDDANGYVRSWRATANGLEGVALGHTDTLLCLDELSQLASKDAGEAAYMLANGAGKSRSSRDGSARKAAKWRVLFLSSGEIGLADKVGEDGRSKSELSTWRQMRAPALACSKTCTGLAPLKSWPVI
jgi:putative DNA primase/helicase